MRGVGCTEEAALDPPMLRVPSIVGYSVSLKRVFFSHSRQYLVLPKVDAEYLRFYKEVPLLSRKGASEGQSGAASCRIVSA